MAADLDYRGFFRTLTGVDPYPYQRRFGQGAWPEIVDVPTGLGKTAAVVVAWLHRRLQGDPETYGEVEGGARVLWIDIASEEKLPLPYRAVELDEARAQLGTLASASPSALPPARSEPEASLVLRRRDLLDTHSDLSGFDVDVSPYVRDAGDLDVAVFWRDLAAAAPDDQPAPERGEICRGSLSQLDAYAKRIRGDGGRVRCRDSLDGRRPAPRPPDRRPRDGARRGASVGRRRAGRRRVRTVVGGAHAGAARAVRAVSAGVARALVRVADWRASAREQEWGDESVDLLGGARQDDAA